VLKTNNFNNNKPIKMLKKWFLNMILIFLIVALHCLSSCGTTTPMFDSYIEVNYPHLSKISVNKSKSLKGVKLAFEEYLKDFDGVDSTLIVFQDENTSVDLKNFYSRIYFIKDYKLDKTFSFNHKNQNPENIDSLVMNMFKTSGTHNINFIADFIKANGMENLNKILDTENCSVLTGVRFARITLFNKNLKAIDSYYFNRGLWCVDRKFQKEMIERFLEKN
jgi:hypothetical protein